MILYIPVAPLVRCESLAVNEGDLLVLSMFAGTGLSMLFTEKLVNEDGKIPQYKEK